MIPPYHKKNPVQHVLGGKECQVLYGEYLGFHGYQLSLPQSFSFPMTLPSLYTAPDITFVSFLPILHGKTKIQSPKTLNSPPDITATVANAGSLSFRRNAASICPNRNKGKTNFTGFRYCCASGSNSRSAPKKVSRGASTGRTKAK